jgi:hypothetical protein
MGGLILVEARGSLAFWQAIIEHGLFEANLTIQVASASEGLCCWPEENLGKSASF